MKLSPLPLVALLAACVGADLTDKSSHSGDTVAPMVPPTDRTTDIGVPRLHTGADHSASIGTPPAGTADTSDSGGSGAAASSAPASPVRPGLSPLPTTSVQDHQP